MKINHFIRKIIRFEFWPFYIFYVPMVPVWFIFSLLSGSFIYFTRANPSIPFGGFTEYSKALVLERIAEKYKVKGKLFPTRPPDPDFFKKDFNFPFICKPDIGERGNNVNFIRSQQEWNILYPTLSYPFIIQEYCDFPVELGILYYKIPDGESGITSIVGKDYFTITGDGKHTLEELFENHIRSNRKDFFQNKFKEIWHNILPEGKTILMEEVMNHCRGTTFYNYNHLISPELVSVFDKILKDFPEFHYGRFDLKVKSLNDLMKGENIKIFELNGVNSEANHIYDPHYSLIKAYKDVFNNLKLVYQISKKLKKKGVKCPNTHLEFISAMLRH